MPILSGLEATRQIRQRYIGLPLTKVREEELHLPSVTIIGLSGNARKEFSDAALTAGMTDYVVKPYRKEDLFAKLNYWKQKIQ